MKQYKPGAFKSTPVLATTPTKQDSTVDWQELKAMMISMNDRMGKIEDSISQMNQTLSQQNENIRKDMALGFRTLVEGMAELETDVENLDRQVGQNYEESQTKFDKIDQQLIIIHHKQMEFAIRLRGVKEVKEEDLMLIVPELLAPAIGVQPAFIRDCIDKMYRVNSRLAKQRQLPRDIVIYFSSRQLRNDISQATYHNRIKIDGKDILVLKEIPTQMLIARKDYNFLTEELKKRQILYRWEVPFGLSLTYEGKRFRLNTVQKAKDFCQNVLKAGQTSYQRKEAQDQTAIPVEEELNLPVDPFAPLEKREEKQTRAVTKRKEKERTERPDKEAEKTEAVGGARPKGKIHTILQSKFQMLPAPKDGI